ncbi:uncharacterized protein LOC126721265 [Quercus robur]|uniref:uncharacterized protein LOC126721265 n=1 Tax=Quercus robur TaxID=38942 RepID=UPI002161C0D7|nr:uncharacterized protein LOC126721265 [Quercus robur]
MNHISEWSTAQKEAVSFNSKAMNAIFNVVSMEEFKRISNVEIAHTAWNILQTVHEGTKAVKINKLRARNRNNVDTRNVKKNETAKNNNGEKPKEKVGQSSNNSLGQQCYGCQDYGHMKSECPTFLRSLGKAMAVTLSDDEVSDHESKSNQEENFMAFTATAVVSEIETADENLSDGELSKNADLQEAYKKLCKIATKDAMNVELSLKKINTLELEKKILLLKLFNANKLLNSVKIENVSLLEKVRSLELELSVAREQIDRTSTSKLDEMLHVQKSVFDKTSLGFVDNGSSTVVNPPKFVLATSSSYVCQTSTNVKVHKVVAPVSRKTRVDLSESEPKKSNQSRNKKNHKPQWFCHFCGKVGHTRPNCFKLQALKKSPE